ncbi:TraR/DksA family transcriptional regulator [Micromonospora sp. DT81.3]|uniref:TraR/DksA family transcriptional regulator n=1 Tax=Micromonospora sp. DT81.3 TaxID=3416523 RepID=UPI003CEB3CA4
MDDATLSGFAALLRERREAAERTLLRNSEDGRDLLSARGDGTADDEHDPEGSTLSGEWAMLEALRADTEHELAEIDAALLRQQSGTYGRCAECGRDIPEARLRARPMTRTCVACAEVVERR